MHTLYTLEIEAAVSRAAQEAASDFLEGCTDHVLRMIERDALEREQPLIRNLALAKLQARGVRVL